MGNPVVSRVYGEADAKSFKLLGRSNSAAHRDVVSTHSTDTPFRRGSVNQFVVQSLMIPVAMVVRLKFRDSLSMMALAEGESSGSTVDQHSFFGRDGIVQCHH